MTHITRLQAEGTANMLPAARAKALQEASIDALCRDLLGGGSANLDTLRRNMIDAKG